MIKKFQIGDTLSINNGLDTPTWVIDKVTTSKAHCRGLAQELVPGFKVPAPDDIIVDRTYEEIEIAPMRHKWNIVVEDWDVTNCKICITPKK